MHPREPEYHEKCFEILDKGGILWLIEREDTREFLAPNLTGLLNAKWHWDKDVSCLCFLFLKKSDAEEQLPNFNLTENGVPIPVKITEHEFIGKE